MLSLSTLAFLASPAGENLLSSLANEDLSDANTLRLLTSLRKDHSPEDAGAALELARLRQKAVEKFGDDAQRMFFTREALEQASDPLIRHYRSTFVNGLRVVDVGCSIGSDALAFARGGADVLGIDNDPLRIEMARLNVAALSISNIRFEVRDAREPLPDADLVFFDPARRDSAGKRIFDVERYQPPLSIIKGWSAPQIWVKLSPGVDLDQLRSYGGTVEFISVEGDLKEAVLRLSQGEGNTYTATLLLSNGEALHWSREGNSPLPTLSAPRAWLVEPDPALIRAGLVTDAAHQWNGTQLEETIAYITTDTSPDTAWARSWRILDWMPFNLKKLRAYLRERNVGNVTVKKRGTAVTPEVLIPQLKLEGNESRTLVLTRCRGEQVVLICQKFGK